MAALCGLQLAPLAAALAAPLPPAAAAFACSFAFFTGMAQQTHAWAHLKRGDVPPPVLALQDAGLLVSVKAHGAHHKPPHNGNYAIVSGAWNGLLDAGLLLRLERAIFDATGVAPRGWCEPEGEWAAEAESGAVVGDTNLLLDRQTTTVAR